MSNLLHYQYIVILNLFQDLETKVAIGRAQMLKRVQHDELWQGARA